MANFLKNVSNGKALVLRFGDGMNYKIQLNPGEVKQIPPALSSKLLQFYLASFRNDLVIVDSIESKKEINNEPVDNSPQETDSEGNNDVPDVEDPQDDKTDSNSDDSDKEDNQEDQEGNSSTGENDPEDVVVYTKKSLKSLGVDELKDIATKLGAEVSEEVNKGDLITIILNKQGK